MTETATAERQYTTVDKSAWGPGPWVEEPDKIQFTDGETGLPCLIVRAVDDSGHIGSGALCGYVGVTEGHPFFGVEYMEKTAVPIAHTCDSPYCAPTPEHVLEVHGGITYSAFCRKGPVERSICHVPAPGQPDRVYWLGFDCAHWRDYAPLHNKIAQEVGVPLSSLRDAIYRDVTYVRRECAHLAQQLAALAP